MNDKGASDDGVSSDFLNCEVDASLTKKEQEKVVQSVELTKALVLMGYQTWTELEPGKLSLPTKKHIDDIHVDS